MKIAIIDDYQNAVRELDCFELLSGHEVNVLTNTYHDPVKLAALISDVEVLVLIRERTKINAELLNRLPNLKLISQTGKVSNHLNLEDCTNAGVMVAEGIGSPIAPAELCWTLILAASRNIVSYNNNLQQGHWQQSGFLGLGRTLNGLTLGIWGYGKIGQKIALYAKAFDMIILVWGSESSRLKAQEDGFMAANNKEEFFSTSDILSLHLRLNEATRGCVTKADLELMKTNSLFVNTSRSGLVEPAALYNELKKVPSKRAAVDVYDIEPALPSSEGLLGLPNVLCTPHLGYVEKNNYELYFKVAFENVLSFSRGKPVNIANRELLSS